MIERAGVRMQSDAAQRERAGRPIEPVTVRVQPALGGRWEVVLPGRRTGLTYETLDDACKVAYRAAAHTRPCELVVHDAYHRVVHHEVINGRDGRRRSVHRAFPG